jgi:hypothetical protein
MPGYQPTTTTTCPPANRSPTDMFPGRAPTRTLKRSRTLPMVPGHDRWDGEPLGLNPPQALKCLSASKLLRQARCPSTFCPQASPSSRPPTPQCSILLSLSWRLSHPLSSRFSSILFSPPGSLIWPHCRSAGVSSCLLLRESVGMRIGWCRGVKLGFRIFLLG